MGCFLWRILFGFILITIIDAYLKPDEHKTFSKGDFGSYVIFSCGGAILNRYYVVTAAHCFLIRRTFPNMVRVGEYNTRMNPDCYDDHCAAPVQDINISECYVPHYFRPKLMENDIALCLLAKPIKFSETVAPICLQPSIITKMSLTGGMGEVAGWGITNIYTKDMATTLQMVKLKLVDNYSCNLFKEKHVNYPFNIICAGGKKNKDSCEGDSGGPLVMPISVHGTRRYYLVGLVSYGPAKCGNEAIPAVYTKISQYQSWILDLIQAA